MRWAKGGSRSGPVPRLDLENPERRMIREGVPQELQADVEDRHALRRLAFRLAAVGVAVEDGLDGIAGERLLQAAGAEEGEDLHRLALDRLLDRRVVEHGDAGLAAQARQRGLQLQRLVHRLAHEVLDDVLSPGAEGAPSEAAAESFDAGEPDALYLGGVAVQHPDAAIAEHLLDLLLPAALEVVVAEHGDDRDVHRRVDLARELLRLLDLAVIRQVAAEQQHVGLPPR